MTRKENVYSKIILSKRKAIKRYGKERADRFSIYISKNIAELKKFPELGVPLRDKNDLDYWGE